MIHVKFLVECEKTIYAKEARRGNKVLYLFVAGDRAYFEASETEVARGTVSEIDVKWGRLFFVLGTDDVQSVSLAGFAPLNGEYYYREKEIEDLRIREWISADFGDFICAEEVFEFIDLSEVSKRCFK